MDEKRKWTDERQVKAIEIIEGLRPSLPDMGSVLNIFDDALNEIERLRQFFFKHPKPKWTYSVSVRSNRCPECAAMLTKVIYDRPEIHGTFLICAPCQYWQPEGLCTCDAMANSKVNALVLGSECPTP